MLSHFLLLASLLMKSQHRSNSQVSMLALMKHLMIYLQLIGRIIVYIYLRMFVPIKQISYFGLV